MTNPTTITDARVEAAARAMYDVPSILGDPIAAWVDTPHTETAEQHCAAVMETCRVMARAALEVDERAAWQPIETAPHNTPVILGWWRKDGTWAEAIDKASWDWSICNGARSGKSRHHTATHWRPRPTPPGCEG